MKIDRETAEKLQHLRTVCIQHEKALECAEETLRDFVDDFMVKHDMWDSPEDVREMIQHLPPGHLRFTLFERIHELQAMDKPPLTMGKLSL